MAPSSVLITVGERIRSIRKQLGLSRRELSASSGVSERFLAQLETGTGNISLTRFADVASALATSPAALLAGVGTARRKTIALLGVRGAGKSTIGAALAKKRGVPFVEIDRRIEEVAGLGLGQIFELHGEDYYRRLERQVLVDVLTDGSDAVLATGGSIVNHEENFALLREHARTVWLKAKPEDHWNRVVAQGDRRPMAENPHAFSELKALLAAREALYSTADRTVDTSEHEQEEIVDLLLD